ncbi:MAG: hypothetical protein JO147_10590 [Actinobacteria bacterium]|nr:hypothetical protein [Actinomycetota bacterium]
MPRTRSALHGIALVLLGAWAGLAPFVGPYMNFGYTPNPNETWNWTAGRGYLSVAVGAAAVLAGLILIASAHRLALLAAAWLGVAAGAWLIVGSLLTTYMGTSIGQPDPAQSEGVRLLETLFYFSATGAAILLISATAEGALSVRGIRDVEVQQGAGGDALNDDAMIKLASTGRRFRKTAEPMRRESTGDAALADEPLSEAQLESETPRRYEDR